MTKCVMYCIFAMESIKKINGSRGKLASMAGHAYLHAYWDSEARLTFQTNATDWSNSYDYGNSVTYRRGERAYKITLVVDTVEELKAIQEEYKSICGVSLVTDAAFTVFDEPTTVCLGLGPILEREVTDTIKQLKVLT